MQGAVAGSPGTLPTNWIAAVPTGLTRTISLGTTNGIEWVEINYAGTATSTAAIAIAADGPTIIAASLGQTWAGNLWTSNSASTGITSYIWRIRGLSAGAGSETENIQSANLLGASFSRVPLIRTLTNASTVLVQLLCITSSIPSSTVVNVTFRIGWPQLELGASVTSPIRTTTAAATRAADAITLTTPPVFGSAYSVFAQGTPTAPTAFAANQNLIQIDDGTASNRIALQRIAGTGGIGFTLASGGSQVTVGPAVTVIWATGSSVKMAAAVRAFNTTAFATGTGVISNSTLALPIGVNRVVIGANNAVGSLFNGYVENFALWSALRLADATMRALVSAPSPPPWVLLADTTTPASLDLDFVAGRYYQSGLTANAPASLLTTSRASVGYSSTRAGVWSSFAANIARITDLGLLVEEARTNSLRTNDMTGAVAGSPGTRPNNWPAFTLAGLTQTISTPTTENGINVADFRFNGTSSSTAIIMPFEATTQIAALIGQLWTGSAFLKLQAGSFANVTSIQFRIQELDSGGANLVNGNVTLSGVPDSTLRRFSNIRTLTNASTAFVRLALQVNVTNGTAVDFTIRIGWPQLELGAFATSPIRTTSAAATRAADVVATTALPAFGSAYTLFAKGTPNAPVSYATDQFILSANDNTNNNKVALERFGGSATPLSLITVGGVSQSAPSTDAVWQQNATGKLAVAVASGDAAISFGTPAVVTAPAALPATISRISLGNRSDSLAFWNGYLERVALWATTRLANATLPGITTP